MQNISSVDAKVSGEVNLAGGAWLMMLIMMFQSCAIAANTKKQAQETEGLKNAITAQTQAQTRSAEALEQLLGRQAAATTAQAQEMGGLKDAVAAQTQIQTLNATALRRILEVKPAIRTDSTLIALTAANKALCEAFSTANDSMPEIIKEAYAQNCAVKQMRERP